MVNFRIKLLFSILIAESCRSNFVTALTCNDSPCKHNSKCENGIFNDNGVERNYKCKCKYGFTGYNCEKIKEECFNNGTIDPIRCELSRMNSYLRNQRGCLNNGVQPKDGLPCKCPPGYFGFRCEYIRGEQNNLIASICRNSPCMNGGICTAINSGFICSCAAGYHGKYCQYSIYSRTYGGFGSLLPFLLFFSLMTMCVYCCCFKKKIPITMEQRILNGAFLETGRTQTNNTNQTNALTTSGPPSHVIYLAPNYTSETAVQKPSNDLPPSYEEVTQKAAPTPIS